MTDVVYVSQYTETGNGIRILVHGETKQLQYVVALLNRAVAYTSLRQH